MAMIMTLVQIVATYAEKLLPVCSDRLNAEQEVWWYLEHVTGKCKAELLTMTIDTSTLENLRIQLEDFIIQRVINKKPLQYIIGSVPFGDLTIIVEPPILIPRPETEEWVLWVIDQCKALQDKPLLILDLCTGTGCIGLQIARAMPEATVIGVDINQQAIALAEKNKTLNTIKNITFLQGDLFEPVHNKRFDLIVSNPPYLTQAEWSSLDPQVRDWEDERALVAAGQGMEIYDRILAGAGTYLADRTRENIDFPQIIMEIGPAQVGIELLASAHNFEKIEFFSDFSGKRRWLVLGV